MTQIATFAAGCFWGVEHLFRQVEGVTDVTVGYTGGTDENPSYTQVCNGDTGHAEAVEISFNSDVVSYAELVHIFFANHTPTTMNQQGPDIGSQYRSAIFYHDEVQHATAEQIKTKLDASGQFESPIVTEITSAGVFYPAEEYHQRYFEKNGMQGCSVKRNHD